MDYVFLFFVFTTDEVTPSYVADWATPSPSVGALVDVVEVGRRKIVVVVVEVDN